MDIISEMNHFYYRMALYELQVMNGEDYYRGLSYNSLLYVNVIAQMPDCTVSRIAQSLGVTKSAVTLKLNELEKQGAVVREQSEKDRRVFYVRLSREMEETIGIYDRVFEEISTELSKKYTEEELNTFGEILRHISGYEWRQIKNE